ncbi:MBL fold metallo-hydrolase [Marinobacter sp. SS21]|uniref:MBL fold metallo-hydrolase n=1 Tax=Marinobacter sp. SS21 TaxID=2979460 RepID=UPI00233131EC|nr:MBL fold metallo-hydrolase [Marinobacter sp. SS21]MDC0663541.1 MBL fold metallo-hydrolase [Marinobacter sp. SS21]
MKQLHILTALMLSLLLFSPASLAASGTVKITPLGSHSGEFCRQDRALILEDPSGTRILYDAGRTVAGPNDPRLGDIDIVLVSHVHGDHIGDRHIRKVNSGSCAAPETDEDALPDSNSVRIAVAKGAKIVTGSDMPRFFAIRMAAIDGNADDSLLVRFGGRLILGNVEITTIPAAHSNGLAPGYLTGPLAEYLQAAGVNASVGPPTGYVLTFSNGLVVYLSGDTGIMADQKLVVAGHYGAKLAVVNIGDTYTTGPTEAAYVVNELLRPNAVIASHANEAATRDGKVLAGTRTEQFIQASMMPVHVPLSGRTMEFDAEGDCRAGC